MKWFVVVFVLVFLPLCLFAEAPGTLLWSVQLEKCAACWPPKQYSLAVGHDGTIYANTSSLYALDKDGNTIWRYVPLYDEYDEFKHIAASLPVIGADGTIYVTLRCVIPRWAFSCQYQLVALSPEGRIKWQAESIQTLEDRGLTNLTMLGNGNIVIGLSAGLFLYSPDGELLKSKVDYGSSEMIGSIVSDFNDNVYHWYGGFMRYDLYKLNSNLEIELAPSVTWNTFADGSVMASGFFIDGNGRIYTTCYLAADGIWPEDWYFGCFTPDGEPIWRSPREDLTSSIIDNKQRFFSHSRASYSGVGALFAYTTTSGEKLWTVELKQTQNLTHMILGNADVLYFGLGNKIVAYSTDNQQLLWEFENDTTIIFITMNQNGTLYGIDENAKVLALTTESTGVEKSAWPMFQHDAQNTGHVSPVEPLAAEARSAIPQNFTVYPIYPNPFNAQAKLKLYQPITAPLKIRVYDLHGKAVADLVDAVLPAGEHQFRWDGSSRSSGIYFFQISGPDFNFVERAILLK